jgi:hypothetical protein
VPNIHTITNNNFFILLSGFDESIKNRPARLAGCGEGMKKEEILASAIREDRQGHAPRPKASTDISYAGITRFRFNGYDLSLLQHPVGHLPRIEKRR